MGRIRLRSRQGGAIQLQKKNPDDEARALVAIHKRAIADDGGGVSCGEIENIGIAIGMALTGTWRATVSAMVTSAV